MSDKVMVSKLIKTATVPLEKISPDMVMSNLEEKPKVAVAAFNASL